MSIRVYVQIISRKRRKAGPVLEAGALSPVPGEDAPSPVPPAARQRTYSARPPPSRRLMASGTNDENAEADRETKMTKHTKLTRRGVALWAVAAVRETARTRKTRPS